MPTVTEKEPKPHAPQKTRQTKPHHFVMFSCYIDIRFKQMRALRLICFDIPPYMPFIALLTCPLAFQIFFCLVKHHPCTPPRLQTSTHAQARWRGWPAGHLHIWIAHASSISITSVVFDTSEGGHRARNGELGPVDDGL